ncbi:phosphoribosylglycinamide formyltransferase 2 [Candidatus Peribacteria bacterium RIFCSPLOWO2_01_FULL_51_18]|nr:MAG: phosphoribosylglycinamide formyltransferase 2 [Candidatus Peribacteria bacterium RIFCSPHIGHO2_02_FULL_51_15]OGJ66683.1 MAG: phosphoribosylglycinamide formyltransferase 2 [Candidatus Peribacteria bacterium RIFCSPLOWO2_01_FULL_51_18]OGJ69787.1 MAG: phosphoribosylglycinamide formyltransferase 2 [Candidatus Peribacteria bacterium RIFCSPLOWO2_02_FULL_51_10]
MLKKILLLGSGELGKELVISLKRLGQTVIAVDSYDGAPAMQVADGREIINMLDGDELDRVINKNGPDIIIPEIEAIRTERLYEHEKRGIHVVPSARAVNYTMNRKAIRELAAKELGVKTAKYAYATTPEEFRAAVKGIGIPCVVKPIMSSSGKGQSTVKSETDIDKAWDYAITKGRGGLNEVIVEEFIHFETEITLLTVTQKNGETLYCPPIGHRQERGDYQESWQPAKISEEHLKEAQMMADLITRSLTGAGIWGVEFFLSDKNGVYFSELSPRPHDTGMVTLSGSQNFSEFELHARAVLGLPIPEISLEKMGTSAVILATKESQVIKDYAGLEEALKIPGSDVRIFGKPVTRVHRRMGVALAHDDLKSGSIDQLRKRAKQIADCVTVVTG